MDHLWESLKALTDHLQGLGLKVYCKEPLLSIPTPQASTLVEVYSPVQTVLLFTLKVEPVQEFWKVQEIMSPVLQSGFRPQVRCGDFWNLRLGGGHTLEVRVTLIDTFPAFGNLSDRFITKVHCKGQDEARSSFVLELNVFLSAATFNRSGE